MRQLKGVATDLEQVQITKKQFGGSRKKLYKMRLMVGGQAVNIVMASPIHIEAGDQVTVYGIVKSGILCARSYVNGTQELTAYTTQTSQAVGFCGLACFFYGLFAIMTVLLLPVGLLLAAVGAAVMHSALEHYKLKCRAERALRRYNIGPPLHSAFSKSANSF